MFGLAQDSGSKFLVEYLKKRIDLTNIRLFFRMKAQDKDIDLFELAFLWNGEISFSRLKEAYKHKLTEFPELMKGTKYAKIIEAGHKHYEDERTFIYLEKEIENHLTDFIKQAKLMAFGPEPLIAYFLAKQNNALIIRMILIHKLNKIDPSEIQKRLRQLYR